MCFRPVDQVASRRDLRGGPQFICSIDPPGCVDVDDALGVAELPGGGWEVSMAREGAGRGQAAVGIHEEGRRRSGRGRIEDERRRGRVRGEGERHGGEGRERNRESLGALSRAGERGGAWNMTGL